VADEAGSLDSYFSKALAEGSSRASLTWKYRLAKATGRRAVAQIKMQRLTPQATQEQIQTAEQEMADAAGAVAFCRVMAKAKETT
jgi:hypothetical protein